MLASCLGLLELRSAVVDQRQAPPQAVVAVGRRAGDDPSFAGSFPDGPI